MATGPRRFRVDPWGDLRRRREREVAPYLYAGVQLATPALFADPPAPPSASICCGTARSPPAGCARWCMTGCGSTCPARSDLSDAEVALHANETGETTVNLATLAAARPFLDALAAGLAGAGR